MAQRTEDALIEALPFPVALIGPGQRLRAANAAARAIFGSDGVGQLFVVTFRHPSLVAGIEQALGDGLGDEIEISLPGPGIPARWRAVIRPVALEDGQGAAVSFEDLSAAETTSQIRRDFVANVSHELRTPLTAFIGFVETLKGAARDDPAARDRFLGVMEREAGRMARLIDDLLSLSRVEQDERVRPTDRVDLTEVVQRAVTLFDGRAEADRIHLNLPDRALVSGDERQLEQVVANLLENALKYGRSGSQVRLDIRGPEDAAGMVGPIWRISVTDEGEGIEPHHVARLTERFYRVDSHRSRELGGTGLGLAIVKHIVTRHRGRLKVESERGKGSVFSVLLPVLASE